MGIAEGAGVASALTGEETRSSMCIVELGTIWPSRMIRGCSNPRGVGKTPALLNLLLPGIRRSRRRVPDDFVGLYSMLSSSSPLKLRTAFLEIGNATCMMFVLLADTVSFIMVIGDQPLP